MKLIGLNILLFSCILPDLAGQIITFTYLTPKMFLDAFIQKVKEQALSLVV